MNRAGGVCSPLISAADIRHMLARPISRNEIWGHMYFFRLIQCRRFGYIPPTESFGMKLA